MVLAVGLGQTSLGVQQQIKRRFFGLKLCLDCFQLDACRIEPVERSLRNDIGPLHVGHSRSDPRAYRTKEEEAYWKDRDPIKLFSAYCVEVGIFSEKEVEAIDATATAEIEAAIKFAIDSPDPDPSELYTDVYA